MRFGQPKELFFSLYDYPEAEKEKKRKIQAEKTNSFLDLHWR